MSSPRKAKASEPERFHPLQLLWPEVDRLEDAEADRRERAHVLRELRDWLRPTRQ